MNFLSIFKRNLFFKFKKRIDIDFDNVKINKLDALFSHYNTDKANFINNGKDKGHGYTKFYERHLKKFKHQNIKILEIGSFSGASAAAFVKFFPNAKIYCIDVNLTNVRYKSDRINFFGLDSSNTKLLAKFIKDINKNFSVKKFDVIIDDGSHLLSDQLFSLNYFYKFLKKNGYYIIEDYKFPNYFKRNNDIDEDTLDILIKKLKKNKIIQSRLLQNKTINELYNAKINPYKGKSKISDIVFFEKK